ncbi:MAG: hypothetical protein KJI69_04860 [Patescibacteria group bacterium]|nr:hypothetical protein [Patescibacteria group bacterium]
MIKRNYEMEILINGRSVKEYFHNYKTYIEGRKGSVFSIRLRNNSSEKTLFVPTVDGLSTIDGKDGEFDSRGYILDANSSMKIDGWRLNDDEVAEFYFSTVEDSYRKRKNKGSNVGSIAVAIFREKEKKHFCWPNLTNIEPIKPYDPIFPKQPWIKPFDDEPYPFPRVYCKDDVNVMRASGSAMYSGASVSDDTNFTTSSMKNSSQDMGTGFGQTKRSEVVSVYFDREEKPDTVLEVFYNSRKQLSNIGVDFNRQRHSISEPNSFPNESGYCERPNN